MKGTHTEIGVVDPNAHTCDMNLHCGYRGAASQQRLYSVSLQDAYNWMQKGESDVSSIGHVEDSSRSIQGTPFKQGNSEVCIRKLTPQDLTHE